MDRGRSLRKRNNKNNKNNVSNTNGLSPYPVGTMMMGSEDDSLSGGGGGGDTLTNPDPDPFAVFAVDFTVPPLETSKSTATSKSTSVRRENGWRNFEDYTFL